MKLKVYQQGGGLIYTPFIPEQWAGQESKSGSGSSGSDDKIDPLDKELINLMKDQNLLPNDIKVIYNRLLQFQRKSRELTATGDYRSVMPGMLQIMQLANVAKTNKDTWDAALNEIRKHNAGSEVAIDSWGRMWVKNSETSQITKIAPSSFDSERYIPLSNSELLYLRQRDPGLAFSDDALNTMITDVVGQKDVQNEIDSIIQNFGKVAKDRFAKGSRIKEIAGDIIDGDIYKIETKYSKADLNDFSGLLFSELSAPSQNLLRARAAMAGNGVLDYIGKMIFSQTDVEENISYDASASKAANGGGSGSGSESLTKDTYPERLTTGSNIVAHWEVIQTGESGHKMYAYAQKMGPVLKNGNGIGTVNLDRVLQEFDASGIIDWAHVTFGDQKLDTIDFPKVVYDGGSQIIRAVLPIKQDGTVDFDAQKKVSDLQDWVNENGVINDAVIEERVNEIPHARWNREKKLIEFENGYSKPFLVVRGIVSSDKVRFDTKSPYILNMDKGEGDPRKDWLTMYNNAISTGTSTEGKPKYDYGKAAGRHLYEGNIYMPITNETIGALIYNDQFFEKDVYRDIRNQAEVHDKALNFKGNYDG